MILARWIETYSLIYVVGNVSAVKCAFDYSHFKSENDFTYSAATLWMAIIEIKLTSNNFFLFSVSVVAKVPVYSYF